MVLAEDADLLLHGSSVKLGLLGEDLVEKAGDGIEDDVRKEHGVRHANAGAARELLDLILRRIGVLELENDLDTTSNEAGDDASGDAVDQERGEALVGDVPHINVQGVRLVDEQHDDVDANLDDKHKEDVRPRPDQTQRG